MKRFLAILLSALMVLSTVSVMAAEVGSATMAVEYVSNGVFRISGTLPGSGDYKVIAAQYDGNGVMIDAKTAAAVDDFGMFSTTMEFSSALAETKFMLWEMNEAAPCAEVVALPEEGGINIITAKTEVGASSGGNWSAAPLTNLVDGDVNTCAILYGGEGSKTAMFVELEAGYEIDRIEVLAYHNFFNRGSGFDVVLGNNVPDNIPYEEDEGEFMAGRVEEDLAATSTAVGYKTFYVPENAGSYRYVSFETFDETDGISIADVKVYVKSLGEQVEYVSVTDNATSHKASSTATANSYETDATNALVDGNLATVYGTGPVDGAYYTFVDLGVGGRPVNKVVITSIDAYGPTRVKGQKYYLANNVPVAGADRTEWVYLGTRINPSVPMTFILDEDQAGTYRYVVVDCTDAAVGGIVAEIEVYKDKNVKEVEYESVTDRATSHKSSSLATATSYETDAKNALVDGNLSTLYGTGPSADAYYTFIDLGEGGRRVDKVAITANDTHQRVKGQKYYLANTLPIAGADRSGWVFLGERVQNGVTMTFILDKAQAGVYRYVVADCTASTVGGYVNEIQVYKDKSVKEIEYVSVTDRATTHLASSTDTAATYDTDPSNRLVDGNLSTSYGVGPVANAYYTFIDLGEGGRRVDMVAITATDTVDPNRIKGQKYYLANTLPIAGADRSGWVFLGERVQSGVTMTFVLDETQAGVYRYVVADCTASTVGGYVNEIQVYKNAEYEEAAVPTNVARGKNVTASATSTVTGYTNPAVITDGVNIAADGNNQFILTAVPSAVCIDLEARYSISEMTIDAVLKNDKFDFSANLEVYISDTPTATVTVPSSATKVLDASATGWDQTVKTLEFDEPIDGRYVIIKKTAKRDNNDSFRLSEVEVMGVPSTETDVEVEATNVALGKATADSVIYTMAASSGYADVSVVTDGSICVGGNSKQFIGSYHGVFCLDLGATYDIEKVMVDAVATQFSGNVTVYIADAPYSSTTGLPANKTAIISGTDEWGVATKTAELSTPVNGRYIIVHRSAGNNFRLGEIEVWGK